MIRASIGRVVFAVIAGAMVLAVASLVPGTIFGGSGFSGLGGPGAAPPLSQGTAVPPSQAGSTSDAQAPVLDLSDEDIPAEALAAYQRAADIMTTVKPHCGLSWTVLAAIGRVETDHGRAATGVLSDRSAGPMSIRPTTWNKVGVDGDGDGTRAVEDLDDAALAVAVYLCAGSEDLRFQSGLEAALGRWNESGAFLAAVLAFDELYRLGQFEIVGDDESAVLAAGLLYGPSLSATPLDTSALLLTDSPRLLPPGVLARVTAEAADAVEAAGTGGPISTETEAVALPTTEVTPSESQSFAAGEPVGEPPENTTPTEQPAELPAALPPELAPDPPPATDPPSAPAPSVPGTTDPAPSAPAPTDPATPTPSDPATSGPPSPTPSDPPPTSEPPAPSDPPATSEPPTPSDPPATSEPPASESPAPDPPPPTETTPPEPPPPTETAAPEPPPPTDTTPSEPAPSETASASSEPAPADTASASSEPAPSTTDTTSPSAG